MKKIELKMVRDGDVLMDWHEPVSAKLVRNKLDDWVMQFRGRDYYPIILDGERILFSVDGHVRVDGVERGRVARITADLGKGDCLCIVWNVEAKIPDDWSNTE